jgi:hypothetical protein
VKAALTRAGLRAPSAFIEGGLLTILRNWDRQLEQAKVIGHDWLVCPTIDARLRGSPENWLRVADTFNKAAERAKPYGVRETVDGEARSHRDNPRRTTGRWQVGRF